MINADNPTVSTISPEFVTAARGAPGWHTQRWTRSLPVRVTTLDALIDKHGAPAFIKIDVEGFEEEALQGLAHAVKALSFEFTTIQRDVALGCIERCIALGYARFNAVLGESQTFVNDEWVGGEEIARWLTGLPHAANSGTSMPRLADHRRAPGRLHVAVAVLIVAGYGLTLAVFYPGIMTYDAKFVHEDIAKGVLGDWQSPVMTVLWGVIDPVAPGPGSMFLLTATSYWFGFGLLAFAVAGRSSRLAILLPLLALTPPAFVFVGIIWRDVLFATTWLVAAAIAFATTERGARLRIAAQTLALVLCAFGVLLRPNALIAAPILVAYIGWPKQMRFKRTAILFVPAVAGFFALVQVVYYGALGATRQHPLQAVMIFDLGGISHYTKQNQFPVIWSEPESSRLLTPAINRPSGTSIGGWSRAIS